MRLSRLNSTKPAKVTRSYASSRSSGSDGSKERSEPSEPSELQLLSQSLEAEESKPKKSRPQLSLKMRAVWYLSRRDHSRLELQRKLASYTENPEEIDRVLLDLEQQGFFSEARFVKAFARRRGEKLGTARVAQELALHRIPAQLTAPVVSQLKSTEVQRALQVWQRRFDAPAQTIEQKVKQHRFLMQRGFSSAAISSVLRGRASLEEPSGLDTDLDISPD
jgi:regulatory protein